MKIRGLVTLFFMLSQTAILNREGISSGIIAHSGAFWNKVIENGCGFDFGMLDLMLLFLCLLVAWVQNERTKINEAYCQRLNSMKTKYLQEEHIMAKLDATMEDYRGRFTNSESPLRKVKRSVVTVQHHLETNLAELESLCEQFEELKLLYKKQSQSYPQNQAEVLNSLAKQRFEVEIGCLKEYIESEIDGLFAEMNFTMECMNG